MTKQDKHPMDPEDLRQKAEKLAKKQTDKTSEDNAILSSEEIKKTLHELRVHQIELEMQNEELRSAQAQIKAGRERYIDLYDLAPVGYCILSEQGLILEANLTVATLLGTARSLLIKQPISRFIFRADQDIYYLHRKKLFETSELQKCELRLVKPKGAAIWAQLTATTTPAENGAPVCRLVISNITDRKQAEEDLRKRESHFRTLVNTIPDLIWLKDADGVFLSCNKGFERLFGVGEADIIGKTDYDFIDKDQADFFRENDRKAMALGGPRSNDEQITFADNGHKAFLETIKTPMFDTDGKLIGILGIGRDITERKQAETYREMGREILQILNEPGDLQESIQRVLATLKTRTGFDAVGLRLQDNDDFPYFVQDGFSQDFLLTENTLVERDKDGDVCRDKDGNIRLECTCGLVISGKTDPSNPLFTQGGSSWVNDSFTLLNLPSDQDPRLHPRNNCIHQGYASVALIPIRTKDQIVGLIQLNDKRNDRFTLESIEILEGIAAHIGSALMRNRAEEQQEKMQAQLIQAQKMESVGRLAGGVAHDFNNMLSVILGNADMILDEMDPGQPFHEDLTEIRKAGKRSANLTRQLVAFARKQTIAPKVIDLNETIESMLIMLRRLIGEDINLSWRPGKKVWPVKMDPTQIDQILANLCVNARDAIAGVGKLTIQTVNTTFDSDYCAEHLGFVTGDFVMLALSDSGCGMNQETLANLFEPFFTTKEVGKGTGLGLATVYGIVKQNDGFINVYSELGQGTTFKVYLSRHLDKKGFETKESRLPAAARGNETVLLVEDEPAILKIATTILKLEGYTVVAAGTPGEAIYLAKEHAGDIHLLLTDVVMPEMNGRDLAKNILSLYPQLKLLFMSGYTANVIAYQGILDEGVNFIQKPFSKRELTVKVQEVLDRD
ncbi:MAG: PAS domain S-box protein [Deltaproteobacteria bacterium]|jgi:PAS domain S-box-containing protein|nr:PAS domain S-box protein [Deltaproteobacteria bacterium]